MRKYLYNMYLDLRIAFSLNNAVLDSLRFTKESVGEGLPPSTMDICKSLTMSTSYYARVTNAMFILIKTLVFFLAVIFGLLVYSDSLSGNGLVEQVLVLFEIYALVNFVVLASVVGKAEILARIIGVNTPMFKADAEDLPLNHPSVRSYLNRLNGRELLMIGEVAHLNSFKD